MVKIGKRIIKGCRPNKRYQNYFNRTNKLYFNNSLAPTRILTAPLLRITQLTQAEAEEDWLDAGEYGIVGIDSEGQQCIILDRGTAVFHVMLTKQTILHEQIHIYISPYCGHGKPFKNEIRRIASLGALDNLI
jgi:hypothetical protein